MANFVGSPVRAEVMAAFEAVLNAKQLHLPKVSIRFDAMNVIKAINSRKTPMEAYGIINDIISLMYSFTCISFSFVPRESISLTDDLEKKKL